MQQQQQIFNNRFVGQKRISSGSFGVVLLGLDKETGKEVAIKIEKEENEDVNSLEREVEVLERLKDCDQVPKLLWSGEQDEHNVIVIQLLGKDLAHYIKYKKKFSLKTVLQLGIHITKGLEQLHNHGVTHRDLKPENILMGLAEESQKVYLVDFGISKIFRDNNGRHIPFRDNKPFIGTTRYASVAAHKGYELCRRDDLESMMYVLIYFLKGQLPWQNMQNVTDEERTQKVGDMKATMDPQELCKDLPDELSKILEYLKTIEYRLEPDYRMIEKLFQSAAQSCDIVLDQYFDWDEQKPVLQHQLSAHSLKPEPMKKTLEKQLSNKNMMQQSQFLIPPEPKQTQMQVQRSDSRQHTISSAQGSVLLGTYNSMNPIYQGSMVAPQSVNVKTSIDTKPKELALPKQSQKITTSPKIPIQEDNNRQNFKQVKSLLEQQQQKESLLQKSSTNMQTKIKTETIGYVEKDLEEYYCEVSLAKKYQQLKLQSVNIKRRVNASSSPCPPKKK